MPGEDGGGFGGFEFRDVAENPAGRDRAPQTQFGGWRIGLTQVVAEGPPLSRKNCLGVHTAAEVNFGTQEEISRMSEKNAE